MKHTQQQSLLSQLLSVALPLPEQESADSIKSWQILAQKQYDRWTTPFERAVCGGFCSLNLGTAFTFGYQSALQAMAPGVVDYNAASFCVTEPAGNKPSAIATTLKPAPEGGWILDGQKSFVSGAEHARRLLVAATTGQDDQGRNQLAMVWLDTDAPGVTIQPLPALPFAPEISHGAVRFEQVQLTAAQRLPGDGYSAFVKPFRTIEDLHVTGAILGYLLRICRSIGADKPLQEQLAALITLHQALAAQPASASTTHLGLAGARGLLERVLAEFEAALLPHHPALAQTWQRDKALLTVAAKARAQRTASAWQRICSGAP